MSANSSGKQTLVSENMCCAEHQGFKISEAGLVLMINREKVLLVSRRKTSVMFFPELRYIQICIYM